MNIASYIFLGLTIYFLISIYIKLDPRLVHFRIKYEKKLLSLFVAIPLFLITMFMTIILSGTHEEVRPNSTKTNVTRNKDSVENLLHKFQCDLNDTSVSNDYKNSFEYSSMQNDIDKVNTWVKNYKNGMPDFNIPIEDVVSQQLQLFRSSCEALGGTPAK